MWKNKGVGVSGISPSFAGKKASFLPSPKQRAPMRICSDKRGVSLGSFRLNRTGLLHGAWPKLPGVAAPWEWSSFRHLRWPSHLGMTPLKPPSWVPITWSLCYTEQHLTTGWIVSMWIKFISFIMANRLLTQVLLQLLHNHQYCLGCFHQRIPRHTKRQKRWEKQLFQEVEGKERWNNLHIHCKQITCRTELSAAMLWAVERQQTTASHQLNLLLPAPSAHRHKTMQNTHIQHKILRPQSIRPFAKVGGLRALEEWRQSRRSLKEG